MRCDQGCSEKGRVVVIQAMLCILLWLEMPPLVPSDILVARAL